MTDKTTEMTAMGLKESHKSHEKNIQETIDSASQDMQKRVHAAEAEKTIPDSAVVMTYSETIVFTGSDIDIKRLKKRWTEQYAQKLPGKHAYNLRKHSRTVMVTPMPDNSQLWQTWDLADVHMNPDAKKRLEANAKPKGDTSEADRGSEG